MNRNLSDMMPNFATVVLAGMLSACGHVGVPSDAPRVQRADVDGTTLAYVEQGRGETVVFVHGAAGDWRTWEPLRPYISAQYRFVSYSRRYHHPNPVDGGGAPYSAQRHADDLIKFVRALGPVGVHGVGASAGGRVLADAAVKEPALFKSLTLSEPGITKPTSAEGLVHWTAGSQEFGKVVAAVRARDARQATVNLIDWVYAESGAFDKLPADLQQRFLDNQSTVIPMATAAPAPPPSCEQLRALPMPVMVMEGEHTRAGFRSMNERLMQCLRNGSRRVIVPGAPHVWYPVNPKFGAEQIVRFISSARDPVAAHATGHPGSVGKVHFKVACNAAAQKEFDVAMAYYHSFAWGKPIDEPLERALRADPSCGMVHWARALSRLDNPFVWPGNLSAKVLTDGAAALEAARATGLRSVRERDYVAALSVFYRDSDKIDHRTRAKALELEMEKLAHHYPDDREAKILHALVLSANFDPADKQYRNQLRAARILEQVFKEVPEHPGVAHYLIHSYDYPPIARQGLDAARRYSKIAPSAAHAQHMPSHIFTRVGAWKDSIESNRASAAADSARGWNSMHAYDYMAYAHLQLGQEAAARRLIDDASKGDMNIDHLAVAYAHAAMPARVALERDAWKQAAGLELTPGADVYPWKKYPQAEAVNAFARGVGAARSGDVAHAQAQFKRLRQLRDDATALKISYWADQIDIQSEVVRGLIALSEGRPSEGLEVLAKAATREDASEKHVVTPGPILPVREILATVLLEQGKAAEALRAFEAVLQKEPNRLRATLGAAQAAERADDTAKARAHYAKVVELTEAADAPPRPEVVHARRVSSER